MIRHLMTALAAIHFALPVLAETNDYLEEDPYTEQADPSENQQLAPASRVKPVENSRKKPQRRKYFTDDSPRTDAGVFHVALAIGGNFYIEPQVDTTTQAPTGDFFKDFGFQAGVYFDHDYSELEENIPLMLRGMVGYKYVLSSVHVFSFDGMVRRMFRFSEKSSFGLGLGGSAAVWYRAQTDNSPNEEIVFLPSLLLGAGFDFNPFLADFKWLINRIGSDNIIMGFELYFGVRL